ncbi:MAG TPA: DUF3108 domain-containing protein [Blastocatellia bacterium]|nr:DUF3108 domain-containing protein [Blastocatellia bacterium]
MLKIKLLALAVAALMLPASFARSQSMKADRAATVHVSSKIPFAVGERLSYDVSWRDFITAGEFTLETKERRSFDGVDGYHVSAVAQTVGPVNAFVFKVNDTYESFINAETLQPFRAQKSTRHGKKREQSSVTIDQRNRTARLSDGRTVEIPADTYDLVGLIYAIRAMDLTVGKSRSFNVLEDGKVYPIRVEAEAREKVTTRAGSFDAIRIATRMEGDGRNSNIYNLKLFITSDARRMPVLITAEPSWGDVRVELTSATGIQQK